MQRAVAVAPALKVDDPLGRLDAPVQHQQLEQAALRPQLLKRRCQPGGGRTASEQVLHRRDLRIEAVQKRFEMLVAAEHGLLRAFPYQRRTLLRASHSRSRGRIRVLRLYWHSS